ncbi:hypothetical protein U9M48_042005 [Paspalum notatum var. saurae]|uniref:F-box protein AT5G49610-like beta-propeller domain-containing protein n=1 Tax=Paspalum notatum var. saurae TaxID=547442 RepID=A0AAQ3URX3_PASNO
MVSKRWLGAASDRGFLRRFLALHPPHFLGFYVTGNGVLRPEFVPVPPSPQPPDPKLSAVLSSVFDAFPECSSSVWDCRNGRVLFDFAMTVHGTRSFGMRDPLRHPDRGTVVELPPPPSTWPECPHAMLLPDGGDGDDDASCYRVDIHR